MASGIGPDLLQRKLGLASLERCVRLSCQALHGGAEGGAQGHMRTRRRQVEVYDGSEARDRECAAERHRKLAPHT